MQRAAITRPAMTHLAAVLLRHDTRHGAHYDWLFAPPAALGDPQAPLWSARVGHPSWCWPVTRHWSVHQLDDHRCAYLAYQGPVSGDRGSVKRIDAGHVRPVLWSAGRIVINLQFQHCVGLVRLDRVAGTRWRAQLLD